MSRLRAMFYAIAALISGVLAYVVGVGSTIGQRAEASVLDASIYTIDPPPPLGLVTPVTVAMALLVLCGIAFFVHGFGRALSIVLVGGGAIVASQFLKEDWLDRPQLFEVDAINTFPSGHMTIFGVLIAGLIWAMPRGGRWLFSLFGAVVMSVVSWQLLEYGWHRPSDLIGAQALVIFAFALASWLGSRRSRRGGTSVALSAINKFTSLGLTLAGVVVLAGGLVLVAVAASTHSDELMLNAGEIALVGLSVLSARTLSKLCP